MTASDTASRVANKKAFGVGPIDSKAARPRYEGWHVLRETPRRHTTYPGDLHDQYHADD
jgi:hypothetical protein